MLFILTILQGLPRPGFCSEYTIMTWNLEDMDLFDGAGIGRVPWQLDAEAAIADTITSIDPDILFIVEAPSFVELQSFLNRRDLDYHLVHVRQQSGNRNFADSMALLTRKPVTSANLVTPPVPGSTRSAESAYLDWSYRGLLVAEYDDMTIIGVHLKSPWDGKQRSYLIRDSQAQAILEFTESVEGNLVIIGDFNDSPGRDSNEQSFGIPDTLGVLEEEYSRSPGSGMTQEKGLDLDHIFIRGGIIDSRRVEETDWSISDHRPVWTIIEF